MLFILPPTIIFGLLHWYLWRRLVRDTRLPRTAAVVATILLVALCTSIPTALYVAWRVSRAGSPALMSIGFGWFGLIAYLTAFLVAWDALRIGGWIARRALPTKAEDAPPAPLPEQPEAASERETRRLFVTRAVVGSALAAASGITALGVRSAVWEITTPDVPVRLARFPRALDGYTIALLTDVHIGPMLNGRFLRHLVEQSNRARPDLVAIGGDLVDGAVEEIGAQVAELRHLRARHGVYFVTGNHEYYSGTRRWLPFLEKLGVRVLMNQHVTLGDPGRAGAHFDLAGVPDRLAASRSRQAPNAHAAVLGRDPERELIMLAHQPVQVAQTSQVGTGLQLSGHTHGGQMFPFGAIALLDQPYLAGLHRHEPTATQVYVSRGTGFWGPPLRVLAPAEIALIRLTA
jgi:predicted MPP superfamily phosphohydrolase